MKDIFVELAVTNFKLRYKGSVLGFVWVLIKPFSIFLLLFLVFSKLGQASSEMNSFEYGLYLLIGIVVFTLVSESILWGMDSLLSKSEIILKVNFPRPIAVASSISLAIANFVINVIIVLAVGGVGGVLPSLEASLYVISIFIIILMLVSGISLFTSIILVRLRDLTHIVELVLQLIFYGSAIFYPIDIVPERLRVLISYNPIAVLIDAIRRAIIFDEIVHIERVVIIGMIGMLILIAGLLYFNRRVKRIAEFF